MFNFDRQEAAILSDTCQSFKQTFPLDNQRGRNELDRLSETVRTKQKLNPLGTNFTILKQALHYYRNQDNDKITVIDQLLTRFKGIC